jgi:cytochrome P450
MAAPNLSSAHLTLATPSEDSSMTTASSATHHITGPATTLLALDRLWGALRPAPDRIPGPSTLSDLALVPVYFGNQLRYLETLHKTWGDVVHSNMGPHPSLLIQDTDLIEEFLLKKHDSFHKDMFVKLLDPIVGQGLLTSEGKLWRKQRKLAAPALQKKQIAAYAETFVSLTAQACEEWTSQGAQTRDVSRDIMALTLKIVVQTLFGMSLEDGVEEIGQLVDLLMEHLNLEFHSPLLLVPQSVKTPSRKKFLKHVARLDDVLRDLIARRRAGAEGDDLLWRFITARDEDGQPMPDKQLRDEAITMFLAGHETTSLAITYAWDLMTRNPDALNRLVREVDEALGERAATMEDMGKLPWTKAVVQETLRLHPPAWILGREAIEDVQLGPWHVKAGTQVITSPWLLHRDARWFKNPLDFMPQRWLGGQLEASLPRYGYMPFGGGPRVCIGNHFAMMEAMLVIATMAQRVRLKRVSAAPLQFVTSVTLRPALPVQFEVSARGGRAARLGKPHKPSAPHHTGHAILKDLTPAVRTHTPSAH